MHLSTRAYARSRVTVGTTESADVVAPPTRRTRMHRGHVRGSTHFDGHESLSASQHADG
jgi:hypothetical protein